MGRRADVLIQAGHQNRTTGSTGASANGLVEKALTPIITARAVAKIKAAGLSVIAEDAFLNDPYTDPGQYKLAIANHFDGNAAAGPQVIYANATDQPATDVFKSIYEHWAPAPFMRDNTTPLRDAAGFGSKYYGFRAWDTSDAQMVIEWGSIGDKTQAAFFKRPGILEWCGDLEAHFVGVRLGKPIPHPGPPPGHPDLLDPITEREQNPSELYEDQATWGVHAANVAYVIDAGLMVGDGKVFDATRPVTRGELASVAARILRRFHG